MNNNFNSFNSSFGLPEKSIEESLLALKISGSKNDTSEDMHKSSRSNITTSSTQKVSKAYKHLENRRSRGRSTSLKGSPTRLKKPAYRSSLRAKKLILQRFRFLQHFTNESSKTIIHEPDVDLEPPNTMRILSDTYASRAAEIKRLLGFTSLSSSPDCELSTEYIDRRLVSLGYFGDDGTCSYTKLVAGAVFFAARIFNVDTTNLSLKSFAKQVGIEVDEMEKIVRQVVSVKGQLVKLQWIQEGSFNFENVAEFA